MPVLRVQPLFVIQIEYVHHEVMDGANDRELHVCELFR
jgi:hypothetical protein